MVVTKAPLFSKADTAGDAQLRPGVWREASHDPCDFDETKPLADWPSCANGFVVNGEHIGGYNTDADGKKTWTSSELIVAGGEPHVIQVLKKDLGVKGLGELPFGPLYLYVRRPTRPRPTPRAASSPTLPVTPILCGVRRPHPSAKGPDGNS